MFYVWDQFRIMFFFQLCVLSPVIIGRVQYLLFSFQLHYLIEFSYYCENMYVIIII